MPHPSMSANIHLNNTKVVSASPTIGFTDGSVTVRVGEWPVDVLIFLGPEDVQPLIDALTNARIPEPAQ